MARRRSTGYDLLDIRDFSGGLNLRDAPSEVAPNESPDCMNITLDERGGVVKRLGLTKMTTVAAAGVQQNLFYWPTGDKTIVQVGASIYSTDFTSYTLIKTFSTTARVAMCDFKGVLIVVHPVDGVWSYDGAAITVRAAGVLGTCCYPWQNQVFVGGDPTAGNYGRVWWCAAGDFTSWPGANYVDIRDVNDEPVTALGAGQGFDPAAGSPGLLVYKKHGTFRINDPSTGAYQTLHSEAGASGSLAIASAYGRTVTINDRGIWMTDGVSSPVLVSQKIDPIFRSTQLNFAYQSSWAAAAWQNRILFSVTWGSAQTTNNRTFEFHPERGWIVPHDFGVAAFTVYSKNANSLYGTSTSTGHTYRIFKGWSDDGSAIASRYQTRWFEPSGGILTRLRKLTISGRGTFSLYVKQDYELGTGTAQSVDIVSGAGKWGTGVWGTFIWGPAGYEDFQQFNSLGVCRSVSFNMVESSTTSATGPNLLTDGAADEVGAFACYGLQLQSVQLGAA